MKEKIIPVTPYERKYLLKECLKKYQKGTTTLAKIYNEMKKFPSRRYCIQCTPEDIQKGKVLIAMQQIANGNLINQ
jgi:hypothetical protein